MDREKVIFQLSETYKLLEITTPHFNQILDYKAMIQGCKDAISLLKEQTHGETFTVIDTKTGKEADEYNIALHEDWAKHLCYCDMEGWAIENDGTLLLVDECGRFAYADRERFKVVWDDDKERGVSGT